MPSDGGSSEASPIAGDREGGGQGERAEGRTHPLALAWRLLPFVGLYVSFGTTLGFLSTGAPLILRVRGAELADIGLLQMLNLPLGLTFLWAGLVDRFKLPVASHRVGWIVAMQALGVLLLLILAGSETASLGLLFALGIATCLTVATMDVALEALIVETVSPAERPTVSSAKFCGASIGGIVGGGVIVGSSGTIGWVVSILIVACLAALPIVPVLFYPERRLRRPSSIVDRAGGRLARLRALGSRALVLGLYFAALHAITGENGLALIDLGVPLATAGLVSGGLASAFNFIMSACSPLLVRRFGTVRLITGFAGGLIASAALMALAIAIRAPDLGIAATALCYLSSSGLGVPVFNMLYRWAEGPRAATDYAILFGAAFFASMPIRVAAPAAAAAFGWNAYFLAAIPMYLAAFLILRSAFVRTGQQ